MTIHENFPLQQLNTFGMKVTARWYSAFSSPEELQAISRERVWNNKPFILGGGSNVLFTRDVDTLVVRNEIKGIEVTREDQDHIYVKAGAGVVWHEFVMYCIQKGFAGAENLSLIPGSVGAGPMQNIGAYGVELKDIFHELEAYHRNEHSTEKFNTQDCAFGYRESVFKGKYRDQFVITNVTFRLNKRPVFRTDYGAIEKELERAGVKEINIKEISDAVIRIRKSKLPDPVVIGNAGSFFKNPVMSKEQFEKIKVNFPDIVSYPSGNDIKLAAGWMIEKCGWKGFRRGDAGVHKDQALVLVNYGNAQGNEIYRLSEEILISVKEKFGVDLEREVNIY